MRFNRNGPVVSATLIGLGMLLAAGPVAAAEVRVAVASNFLNIARQIARTFEEQTGHQVQISAGSTGKLYAQIINGAPFDIFLAADDQRPRKLEEQGLASHRLTYAIGQLVLWAPAHNADMENCRRYLVDSKVQRLAIANPATAPYGQAARETLASLGVSISPGNLILGENVSQAYAFAYSGNVDAALIARSQWLQSSNHKNGCSWPVPANRHQPLLQQAVLLARAANNPAALDFINFLPGSLARELIASAGYLVPAD
jgi:molybdate transport system substrate-binding protein